VFARSGGAPTGVLRVYGVFGNSAGAVLDIVDYYKITQDTTIQETFKAFFTTHTIPFIRERGGLDDPNFGPLLGWASTHFLKISHGHHIFIRSGDQTAAQPLNAISYSPDYPFCHISSTG
jgi:hypothetical protein